MTLTVPDHSLNIDRGVLAEFLINFARFEYAVQAAEYSRDNGGYAEPDWIRFCQSITTDFWSTPNVDLRPHLRYILRKPPKKLVKLNNGRLLGGRVSQRRNGVN